MSVKNKVIVGASSTLNTTGGLTLSPNQYDNVITTGVSAIVLPLLSEVSLGQKITAISTTGAVTLNPSASEPAVPGSAPLTTGWFFNESGANSATVVTSGASKTVVVVVDKATVAGVVYKVWRVIYNT